MTFEYELTDARAAQAVRESLISTGRKLFTPGFLILVFIVTVIMIVAIIRDVRGWLVLFWSAAPILFVLMLLLWLIMLVVMPRLMVKKMAHLPHRNVVITLEDEQLQIRTAAEQLAVDWSVLDEMRELRNYWVLCLKGGAEIPLMKSAIPEEALMQLRSKAAWVSTRT